MSRIVLSNNVEWYETIKNNYLKYDLKNSSVETDEFNFCCFKKVNVNNYNFYAENGDFVACNGTVIYKQLFGKIALEILLKDLRVKSVKEIREDLVGTFAIICKIGNTIRIFVDEGGNYAIHYHINDKNYIVTNKFYNIQQCCNQPTNMFALKEIICEHCILDNETVFNNTYRLMGDEQIVIDLYSQRAVIEKIELNFHFYSFSSFDDAVTQLSEKIAYYAKLQHLISTNKILFMTGGMDSRIILAGDLNIGITPTLGNWQGSTVMNSRKEDSLITNKIAEGLQLKFIEFDVSCELEDIDTRLFDQIGEDATLYGGNKKWYSIFSDYNYDIYDFGFFGETIKGWDALDAVYKTPFTIDDFASLYISRSMHSFINDDTEDKYREYIYKKIKKICSENDNIDAYNLSKEDCMFLYYIYRTHADTKRVNLVNYYGYSINLLGQKDLIDLINQMPYEYKKHAKANIATTQKLCPDLLEYHYFSHCTYMALDKQKMRLVASGKRSRINHVKSIISKMIGEKLTKIVVKLIRNKNTSDTITEYVNNCNAVGGDRISFHLDESTFSYIADYNTYWSYACMMRLLDD